MENKGYKIKEMLLNGCTYTKIANELDVALSTIAYHAKRIGKQHYTLIQTRHNWAIIQKYYDEGHTIKETTDNFNTDWSTIKYAVDHGKFTLADRHCPIRKKKLQENRDLNGKKRLFLFPEDVLTIDSKYAYNAARRLVKEYCLLLYKCSILECPLQDVVMWCGKPIVLHLDHINGIRNDHRLENLRWLCPNCHSQTETYCGRNNKVATGAGNDPAS